MFKIQRKFVESCLLILLLLTLFLLNSLSGHSARAYEPTRYYRELAGDLNNPR
jgi:hypothetical protein